MKDYSATTGTAIRAETVDCKGAVVLSAVTTAQGRQAKKHRVSAVGRQRTTESHRHSIRAHGGVPVAVGIGPVLAASVFSSTATAASTSDTDSQSTAPTTADKQALHVAAQRAQFGDRENIVRVEGVAAPRNTIGVGVVVDRPPGGDHGGKPPAVEHSVNAGHQLRPAPTMRNPFAPTQKIEHKP